MENVSCVSFGKGNSSINSLLALPFIYVTRKVGQNLLLWIILYSTLQYFLTQGMHNEVGTRVVFSVGFLPEKFKYIDELIISLTMMVFVFDLFVRDKLKNAFLATIIIVSLLTTYIIALSILLHSGVMQSLLYIRGEFQSVFVALLLIAFGIKEDRQFRIRLFRLLEIIFVANILLMVIQSCVFYLRFGTFFLRDLCTGIMGGAHASDFGIYMVFYFVFCFAKKKKTKLDKLYLALAIVAIVISEFKAGMLFIPVFIVLYVKGNPIKKVLISLFLLVILAASMEYIQKWDTSKLLRSQTVVYKGSSGRLFTIGWIWNKLLLANPLVGYGPGNVLSSTANEIEPPLFQEIAKYEFTGSTPQTVILVGEVGIIGILLVAILFAVFINNAQYNKRELLMFMAFYCFLGVLILPVMEMQVTSVLFWTFFLCIASERDCFLQYGR